MTRILVKTAGALCLMVTSALAEDAPTPQTHAGYVLAQTIAAAGCVITEENTNLILFEAGIQPPEFPPMAIALLEDGILAPTGNGTMTLVNWGACLGADADPDAAQGDGAAEDAESSAESAASDG